MSHSPRHSPSSQSTRRVSRRPHRCAQPLVAACVVAACIVASAFEANPAGAQQRDATQKPAASPASSSHPSAAPASRLEFTRMIAHWDAYGDASYLDFVAEAQPEVAQLGFYGAHFWSLAHTPQFSGYPAHFPVRGLPECGKWFEDRNKRMHELGVKVVGHFNVEFLVGDPDGPDGPRGFFKFYRDLWDEKELGPRPVANPLDLLEKNADGTPIGQAGYGIGGMREYWGCLRNPHWQAVLKAWIKRGIERGVDGYIANYFYRHNCLCEHCQRDFRGYLNERFTAAELKERFAIDDLAKHRFTEIVSWHDPRESTPLRREMLRFSQLSNKQVFDDLFLKFGRSIKPDLITAQWNHLGNFSQISGDERCLLPGEKWGAGESYLWYSTGDAANATDLANRFLGEGTLQARYIRGAFDDKPFTLGKYESTRIRAAIAELAANGGAPMGFYTRFTDPAARAEIVRYYQFLKRYDTAFRGNRPHSEAVLLFPRRSVHAGDLTALENFRKLGQKLLDAHVLFDVLPDDGRTETSAPADKLPTNKAAAVPPTVAAYRLVVADDASADRAIADRDVSRFGAPFSVRVSGSVPAGGGGVDLHFVNYDRDEPPRQNGQPSPGGGIKDEKPRAVSGVKVDFRLPSSDNVADNSPTEKTAADIAAVEFATPESPAPVPLKWTVEGTRLKVELPEFLVYGLLRIRWKN